jgi:hypothetical protein
MLLTATERKIGKLKALISENVRLPLEEIEVNDAGESHRYNCLAGTVPWGNCKNSNKIRIRNDRITRRATWIFRKSRDFKGM